MPVLQVPAGEEGCYGGNPNPLKKGENEEDGEEKKEDDDDEEEMESNRRDVEDMHDSLVLWEGTIIKFPWVYFVTFAVPASRLFPARSSKTITSYRYTKTQHDRLSGDSRGTKSPATCHPILFVRRVSKHMVVVHGASRP